MSKVMQALEHSQKHHAAAGSSFAPHRHLEMANESSTRLATKVAIVAVLAAGGAAIGVFQAYQFEKSVWLNQHSEPMVNKVSFDYQSATAPKFNDLLTTNKPPPPSVLTKSDSSEITREIEFKKSQPSEQEGFLDNIDLSALSPDIAMRVEAAINNSKPVTDRKRTEDEVSILSQQVGRWSGKLPAMNFQTHVYSSDFKKRWVKINNIEYSEGDWIDNETRLEKIEQQTCLIRFKQSLIEVPALYDWKG